MPRRRATRSKLSRRRVGASAPRPFSPELPFLEPPPDAPDLDPASAGGRTGTLLAPRTTDARKIAKGDVVFPRYRGVHHPALVTRLAGKKAVVKFVYDLVVLKKGLPFKKHQSACLRFTYEEKNRQREAAQAADLQTREKLLLAIEAVEELENTYARDPVDDPEEFFKTQCDYIVRLRSSSASPKKGAAGSAPGLPSARALPSPLRLPPLAETRGDSDEDEEEDGSDEAPLSPPLPPLPPPPPLPPHLREEQCAYAARLLEVILSKPCSRLLRAVHAGKVPSWRRDAFWRGGGRCLVIACSLGDLETCPQFAEKARQEALRLVDRLKGRRPVNRRQYAEEVMAPEAMLFSVSALSAEPRSADELEAELSRGSPRFHT